MPMMAMSIGAHIASMVILNSVLNCTCLLRYWVLRGTVRIHPSRRATDWLYYIMVSIAFIQTCVMVYRLTQVKWVYDHVPPEEIPPKLLEKKLLVPLFIETVGYAIDIYLVKGAFIAMYYDLFHHLSVRMRWALHCLAATCVLLFIMTFVMTFTWCRPLNSYWEGGVNTCSVLTDLRSMNIITWASVGTDILLVILPTLILKSLDLRSSEIWAMAFVYIVGFTSIGATIARYTMVYGFIKDSDHASPDTVNLVEFWGAIEVFFGAFAFVLPTFRAFSRRIFSLRRATQSGNSGYSETRSKPKDGTGGGGGGGGGARRSMAAKMPSIFSSTTGKHSQDSDIEEDAVQLRDRNAVHIDYSFEVSSEVISIDQHGIEQKGSRYFSHSQINSSV